MKSLFLIVCLLGFSSLAFAGIDVTFEQVNADGQIIAEVPAEVLAADAATVAEVVPTTGVEAGAEAALAVGRLLGGNEYACTLILYTKENIQANGGLLAVLNIFGPPFEGEVNDLDIPGSHPSYFHNLHRIVYGGANCNCQVTIHQKTNGEGKSIDYFTKTRVNDSDDTKVDIDWCWANKAESLSIKCRA